MRSKCSEEELDKVRQTPVRTELAEEPSIGEVVWAVKKLKLGKAGGNMEILAEMIRAGCGSEVFSLHLVDLIKQHGETKKFPMIGVMLSLFRYPRKATLHLVTFGGVLPCWGRS